MDGRMDGYDAGMKQADCTREGPLGVSRHLIREHLAMSMSMSKSRVSDPSFVLSERVNS